MSDVADQAEEVKVASCDDALAMTDETWAWCSDCNKAAHPSAVADLPGGPRGYQVVSAAARGSVGSHLMQHLGVDRTVMTPSPPY